MHATRLGSEMNGPDGAGAVRIDAVRRGVAGRLNAPRPALVETAVSGEPRLVDRWWTDDPVDRRYFEVVLESGRNACVYRDGERRCWFTQRA